MTVALALVGAIAGGLALWLSGARRAEAPTGTVDLETVGVYGEVPPFTLTERSGRRVTLEDLRGVVWIANFIYTQCTESCPTQSLQLAGIDREADPAAPLRLVSITVEPEHDSPEILTRYAERHGASDRWWFLTGARREIYCLAREGFRLSVVDPKATGPIECATAFRLGPTRAWAHHGAESLILHSERFVLVDGQARIRAYHLATDPESLRRLKGNLRHLLAEVPDAAPIPR